MDVLQSLCIKQASFLPNRYKVFTLLKKMSLFTFYQKKKAIATGDSIVESLKRQRDLLESFRVKRRKHLPQTVN